MLIAFGRSPDEARPFLHQNAALPEQVGPAIGSLHPIGIHMRQGELADLAGRVRALGRPVPERRAEAVRLGLGPELPEKLGNRVVADRAAVRRREDQVRVFRQVARLVQDFQRARTAAPGDRASPSCGSRGPSRSPIRDRSRPTWRAAPRPTGRPSAPGTRAPGPYPCTRPFRPID